MTMQSTDLLPALRELSAGTSRQLMSFRDMIAGLVSTERTIHAAEFVSASSSAMWTVFDRVNVDDRLAEAYATRWPEMAGERSLHEQWQVLMGGGEGAGERSIFWSLRREATL